MKKHALLLIACCVTLVTLAHPFIGRAQSDLTCDDLGPSDAQPAFFIGLGDAYFTKNNFTGAIAAYTCALERDPSYAPAYVNRGFAHVTQHNHAQAMADYNHALELDSAFIAAYNNRGMLYLREGNFGLAIGDFTLAMSLDPVYAPAYHNRALVHAAEGHYDLAIHDLQQAIALDPGLALPHAALGAVYSALALDSYARYATLAPPSVPLPFGDPGDIIREQERGRAVEDFSLWLDFLVR